MVIGIGVREVHTLSLLHGVHSDPVDLRIPGRVVLLDARVHAAPAADAAREVERVAELDPRQGGGVGDRHRGPERLACTAAPAREALPSRRSFGSSTSRFGSARGEDEARPRPPPRRRRTRRRERLRRRRFRLHRSPRPLRRRSSAARAGSGRRLRRQGTEARLVGVVAVRAEEVPASVRSTRRSAGRARRPSSPGASRRGTGRTGGRTPRTGSARRSRGGASRGPSASWQSRHQRCCSSCRSSMSSCISVRARRVRFTFSSAWQLEQGKIPSEKGGGGSRGALPPVRGGVRGRVPARMPPRRRTIAASIAVAPASWVDLPLRSSGVSTTRCISRSHIVWNTWRRWPITAARFRVTVYADRGMRREVLEDGARGEAEQLAVDRRRRVQRETVGRDEARTTRRSRRRSLSSTRTSSSVPRIWSGRVSAIRPRTHQVRLVGVGAETEQRLAAGQAGRESRAPGTGPRPLRRGRSADRSGHQSSPGPFS